MPSALEEAKGKTPGTWGRGKVLKLSGLGLGGYRACRASKAYRAYQVYRDYRVYYI